MNKIDNNINEINMRKHLHFFFL